MHDQFWSEQHLSQYNAIALQTESQQLSYKDLNKEIDKTSLFIKKNIAANKIAFLLLNNNIESVVTYLACLRESIVPLLLPGNIDKALLDNLKNIYIPGIIFNSNKQNSFEFINSKLENNTHSNLAILLSTSGSTGSPKLVRLSKDNIISNTKSISSYLNIKNTDKALCSMPLSYSYGLSVLNTHLLSGACTYLTEKSPFDKEFYEILDEEKITSLSGVPFFYNILFRTGFIKKKFPSLKTMTQAGGAMPIKLTKIFVDNAIEKGIDFFVMYGQTEATARMTFFKTNDYLNKIGSIGRPIPGGNIVLSPSSEIVYSGRNVMLGYAENREELNKGDVNKNVLKTGDIGKLDEDEFIYIIGRKKRFIKIAGSRFNLDDIEMALEQEFENNFMLIGSDENLIVCYLKENYDLEIIYSFLQDRYNLNRTFINLELIDKILTTSNGKKDYEALRNKFL